MNFMFKYKPHEEFLVSSRKFVGNLKKKSYKKMEIRFLKDYADISIGNTGLQIEKKN